ncbi:MAG: transcription termination factor Rho, partial [Phycisphaerales bacterium JB039]
MSKSSSVAEEAQSTPTKRRRRKQGSDDGAERDADSGAGGGEQRESRPADAGDGDKRQDYNQSQPQQSQQSQQQRQGEQGRPGESRRRKRKKRKGGGGGGPGSSGIPDHVLPTDEELEREAAELERVAAKADRKALADMLSISQLQRMEMPELYKIAEKDGLDDYQTLSKQDLIFKLLKVRAAAQGLLVGDGTLEIMSDGFGFLRSPEQSYLPGPDDIYVSPSQIRRFGLKKGMEVKGLIRPPRESERYFALLRVEEVNGRAPTDIVTTQFEDLTPLHPEERYILETTQDVIETRIIDLVTPLGKGQRALIVAPPRTGKTILLQKMTQAITINSPKTKIIVLLVDERPEEVTDFRRNTQDSVEVVASTFDEQTSRHVQVAEMVIEK